MSNIKIGRIYIASKAKCSAMCSCWTIAFKWPRRTSTRIRRWSPFCRSTLILTRSECWSSAAAMAEWRAKSASIRLSSTLLSANLMRLDRVSFALCAFFSSFSTFVLMNDELESTTGCDQRVQEVFAQHGQGLRQPQAHAAHRRRLWIPRQTQERFRCDHHRLVRPGGTGVRALREVLLRTAAQRAQGKRHHMLPRRELLALHRVHSQYTWIQRQDFPERVLRSDANTNIPEWPNRLCAMQSRERQTVLQASASFRRLGRRRARTQAL